MSLLAKISSRLAFVTGSRALFCFVQPNVPSRVSVSLLPFHCLYLVRLLKYSISMATCFVELFYHYQAK